MGLPMPHDSAGADSQDRAHLARTPVCGCLRDALRGQRHQLGHIHLHRRRAARQVALNTLQPGLQEAFSPARDLHATDAELLGDVLVLQALRCRQHDLGALANLTLVRLERANRASSRCCSSVEEIAGALACPRFNLNRSRALDAGNPFKLFQ